jgi:hypothetical protein
MLKEVQQKFAATLMKFRDSNAYCATFSRLWGLADPLDESWCDYYLEVLCVLVDARALSDEIVLPAKANMGYMVCGGFSPYVPAGYLSFGPIEKR